MNKKGNVVVVLIFFVFLFIVLFLGVLLAFGSVIIDWTFDEIIPEISTLGMVGDANLTQAADYTIVPLNSLVQSFTWATGALYVLILIGLVGTTVAFRTNPSRWLIGFFFFIAIMFIFTSIFISNIYEDFYTGTDEIALRLQEHTLLSYMIIYSPAIFTVITFVMGIILFSGMQREEFM